VAVAGLVTRIPDGKGLMCHKFNKPCYPVTGFLEEEMTSSVFELKDFPFFGEFSSEKVVPTNGLGGGGCMSWWGEVESRESRCQNQNRRDYSRCRWRNRPMGKSRGGGNDNVQRKGFGGSSQ
jgi:hypothetical protein